MEANASIWRAPDIFRAGSFESLAARGPTMMTVTKGMLCYTNGMPELTKELTVTGLSRTVAEPCGTIAAISARVVVPAMVADAAAKRFLEFFAATFAIGTSA